MSEKRKVLVTGSEGFIGRTFVNSIDRDQFLVYGLDNTKPLNDYEEYFRHDITAEFKIPVKFDYVYHLAAYNITHIGDNNPTIYSMVNVKGTKNVLNACEFKKFIFQSTSKVYDQGEELITESSGLNPSDEYEKSKLEAEKVCQSLVDEDKLIILRSVNVVGTGQEKKALLPLLFNNARENKPIEIFVPKRLNLQLLCVNDLIELYIKLLDCEEASGIYNISSNQSRTIEDVAYLIKEITGSHSEIYFNEVKTIYPSTVSSDKILKDCGWKAKHGINEILSQIFEDTQNAK